MQAGLLLEEAAAAAGHSGHSLEGSSVLTPLLSGTLPTLCTVCLLLQESGTACLETLTGNHAIPTCCGVHRCQTCLECELTHICVHKPDSHTALTFTQHCAWGERQAADATTLLRCAVSTMPDAAKFMQTFQVTSPAKAFFTSLRRYPTMRGEVEVSMRGLRAALGQAYKATHAICERLVKLKVHHATTLQCHNPRRFDTHMYTLTTAGTPSVVEHNA